MFHQSLTRPFLSFSSRCRNYRSSIPKSITSRHISSTHVRLYIQYERYSSASPKSPFDYRKWDSSVKLGVGIGILGSVYYISHLEQVPETGRWRFMNTSKKFEERIGELARQQSREEYKNTTLPPNHMLSKHVRRVVARILAASNLGVVRGDGLLPAYPQTPGFWNPDEDIDKGSNSSTNEWDVIVVNDPKMVNAQVVPGLIIVYTGILPVCKDEQGLAAVLAHEIGHVVARHTAERISSRTVVIGLLFLLSTLGLDMGISDAVQTLLFELPNSRTQELEADRIGLSLMSRACFDPRGAPEMLARLGQMEAHISSRIGMDFLQTHPSSASRVEKLEQILPEAYALLAANPECAPIQDQLQIFREVARGRNGATENSFME
ncbi:peptidase family M48-domain-containing protein [Collybia nuda]|uniref:Peptidase family M48-domain-containing protein n=1 Tax=Collybia nuda TaxID=64659 RepID=A0A9P5XYP9_9AGAR|nr:peptidase family M48-domain-containing protein [Collybia nuda]